MYENFKINIKFYVVYFALCYEKYKSDFFIARWGEKLNVLKYLYKDYIS